MLFSSGKVIKMSVCYAGHIMYTSAVLDAIGASDCQLVVEKMR